MIYMNETGKDRYQVTFAYQEETDFSKTGLVVGLGEKIENKIQVKEAFAKAVKTLKEHKIQEFSINVGPIVEADPSYLRDAVEGTALALYEPPVFPAKEKQEFDIELFGGKADRLEEDRKLLTETLYVTQGVTFARDMVNMPGNKLRPMDFAREIMEFVKDTKVEAKLYTHEEVKAMNMGGLLGVGESSEFPPCLLVLRYLADPDSQEIYGLVGKGVTCDTGGYCLKPAGSMLGIKGDMAGGAAVAGAIYALAKNEIKTNAVAVIPMCENRISRGSLLPGDVITSYAGKTIEIANTDAEGRLILADAVAYAVKEEKVTKVLDIATLTGAVVNMLGLTIAGLMCDDDDYYEEFKRAYETTGEKYWRLPFEKEHEKMIESKIADIRNMGESFCGTITAGLFIRAFAEKTPWLHLDIAGSAWMDSPAFEFLSKGATGAGVSSIYQMCKK